MLRHAACTRCCRQQQRGLRCVCSADSGAFGVQLQGSAPLKSIHLPPPPSPTSRNTPSRLRTIASNALRSSGCLQRQADVTQRRADGRFGNARACVYNILSVGGRVCMRVLCIFSLCLCVCVSCVACCRIIALLFTMHGYCSCTITITPFTPLHPLHAVMHQCTDE